MPNAKLRLDFKCVTSQQELLFRLSCKFNPQLCTYFPCGSAGKEPAYNVGDLGSIPGLGDPLQKGTATHCSILGLENSMARILYSSWGLKESDTTERLSLSLFHFPVITFKHLFLYLPCKDYRAPTLDRLMLKLKLQYFGILMQRADSLEKTLMLGKIEGGRRRG